MGWSASFEDESREYDLFAEALGDRVGPLMLKITAEETRTGRRVVVEEDWRLDWSPAFYYVEGNMSCDCNRFRWFYPDEYAKWVDGELEVLCGSGAFRIVAVEAGEEVGDGGA